MQGKTRDLKSNRERLRAALIELIGERDYQTIELADLLDRAGISLQEFRRSFASLDDCYLATWEMIRDQFSQRSEAAFAAEASWRDAIRALAWTLCEFIQADRARARTFLLALPFGGEVAQAKRDLLFEGYADLIHLGRLEPGAIDPPRVTAEAITGAIFLRALKAVTEERLEDAPAQVPEMMYFLVLPYLGRAAAIEELRRGPSDIAAYGRGELLPFSRA